VIEQGDLEQSELHMLALRYLEAISKIADRYKVSAGAWLKAHSEIGAAIYLLEAQSDDPRTELLRAEEESRRSGLEREWITAYGSVSSLLDRGVSKYNARKFLDQLLAQFEHDAKGLDGPTHFQMSLPG